MHNWTDLQSVHGFHCYDNTAPNVKYQRVFVLTRSVDAVIKQWCLVCRPLMDWWIDISCSPLITVPSVTAHPSKSSVPTSYTSSWHCNYVCSEMTVAVLMSVGGKSVGQWTECTADQSTSWIPWLCHETTWTVASLIICQRRCRPHVPVTTAVPAAAMWCWRNNITDLPWLCFLHRNGI